MHFLPVRKGEIQSTMYEGTSLERGIDWRLVAFMLSMPAFMSRKRVETFRSGLWRVLISWVRVTTASEVLRTGRKPHWLGWIALVGVEPSSWPGFYFFLFFIFFYYMMYSLLKYKNSHGALAMA